MSVICQRITSLVEQNLEFYLEQYSRKEGLFKDGLVFSGENPQIIMSLVYVMQCGQNEKWKSSKDLPKILQSVIEEVSKSDISFIHRRRLFVVLSYCYPKLKEMGFCTSGLNKKMQDLAEFFYHELLHREDLTRFTSSNVGYGTNHLAIELFGVCMYWEFCRNELPLPDGLTEDFLLQYLDRMVRYMNEGGYWAECDGPALAYNTLTSMALLGSSLALGVYLQYQKSFQRCAKFHALTTLPNTRFMDIADGRNHGARYSDKCAVLATIPEGVGLIKVLVSRLEKFVESKQPLPPESLSNLLMDSRMIKELAPEEDEPWHYELDEINEEWFEQFGFKKKFGWIAGVSNLKYRPRPEGHFNLDYQSLFSLYHQDFGIIFSGLNSKFDASLATFCNSMKTFDGYPVEGEMLKFIPTDGFVECQEDRLVVERDYRGFEGRIEIIHLSELEVEIQVKVRARKDEYPVNFQLILPLAFSEKAKGSNGQLLAFEGKGQMDASHFGEILEFAGEKYPNYFSDTISKKMQMKLPQGAQIKWPVKPFDPYNLKTHWAENTSQWCMVAVIPVDAKGCSLHLKINS